MAFDSLRGKVVLFGGRTFGNTWYGDTWEWDGSTWTQVATTGPQARSGHAMAYDSLRHRVVLFGGTRALPPFYLADTWEWDGTNWIPISASGPPPRTWHALAYDSQRNRTVLFGGYAILAAPPVDTWEWDGTNWTLAATSGVTSRNGLAMAFDSLRARTVLFGGRTDFFSPVQLSDTREWDGSAWIQLGSGSMPAPRSFHAMAFDGGNVLLFGGNDGGAGVFGDTWAWNGISWNQVMLAGPSPRYWHAMAYDSVRGRTVLFGGGALPGGPELGDTWEWDSGQVAIATTYGSGCGSPSLGFQPNPTARPIVGQVARATIGNPPTSVAAVMIGLSNQYFGAFPLPVTLAGLGMPGCDLWQSDEFSGFGTSPLPPSSLEFSLLIPNVPGAVGFRCYLQSYAFAPGQNPLSIIVSNGIEWRFGLF